MRLHRLSSLVALLALLGGIGLFAWMFLATGVLADLAALPPAILLALPWFGVVSAVNTVSWRRAFPADTASRLPPFHALFTIRLAGEAINNALASAYVAGEPVKGLLAVPYGTRPATALASSLIGKTANVLGEVLFLFAGVGVGALLFGGASRLVTTMLVVAAVGLAVVLVGVFVQRRRVVGRGARLLQALRLGPRRVWDRALPGADAIDGAVAGYYRDEKGAFAASSLWAALGWILGSAEVGAFLAVATPVPQPWLHGLAIEAGIAVVKGLSFFVPGSLGAQEGGIVWLFEVAGAGTPAGLAYAVFRRFRELVFAGLGFGTLAWHVRHRPPGSV